MPKFNLDQFRADLDAYITQNTGFSASHWIKIEQERNSPRADGADSAPSTPNVLAVLDATNASGASAAEDLSSPRGDLTASVTSLASTKSQDSITSPKSTSPKSTSLCFADLITTKGISALWRNPAITAENVRAAFVLYKKLSGGCFILQTALEQIQAAINQVVVALRAHGREGKAGDSLGELHKMLTTATEKIIADIASFDTQSQDIQDAVLTQLTALREAVKAHKISSTEKCAEYFFDMTQDFLARTDTDAKLADFAKNPRICGIIAVACKYGSPVAKADANPRMSDLLQSNDNAAIYMIADNLLKTMSLKTKVAEMRHSPVLDNVSSRRSSMQLV